MDYIDAATEKKEEMKRAVRAQGRSRGMTKFLCALAAAALLLGAVFLFAWTSGRNSGDAAKDAQIQDQNEKIQELEDKIQYLVNNPIIVEPVSPEIDLTVVNAEIKEIGELATVEYLFTDAGSYTDSAQIKDLFGSKSNKFTDLFIPGTEKSFTMKWDGVIKAGIQVDQIKVELEETEGEKKLIVTMPRAEILSYDTDENSFQILDEKNNIFNPIHVEEVQSFHKSTEEEMKQRAIDNGILEKAEASAEKIIEGLLLSNPAVDETYTIEFVYAS